MIKKTLTNFMKKSFLNKIGIIALTCSVASYANAKTDVPAHQSNENTMSSAVSGELQNVLDTILVHEQAQFPGIILRIEAPNGVWNGAAGVNDLASKKAIDPNAKFRAASIIKPFISTVLNR